MRITTWLAAFAVVLGMGAATASALRSHATPAYPLAAAMSTVHGAATNSLTRGLTAGDLSHNRRTGVSPTSPSRQPAHQPPAAAPSRGPAGPSIVIGSYQQALINRDRAAAGLPPLTWSSCLASVAAANAVRLSRQGWVQPYHTNGPSLDLGCHLGNQAGENVGYWTGGINDGQLNTMFMNSPEHHANIMGPYHYIATAWAIAPNGYAYVAVEFG
jgi:uncharacterized protein YkwD